MRIQSWGTAALALLGAVLVSLAGYALPTFTDLDHDAGNLNPTDIIVVQDIQAQGDSTSDTIINGLTVQNVGTADYTKIVKIEVLDGGGILGEATNLAGLTTGGVTINVGQYTIPASGDESIRVRVTIAPTTTIVGGETVNLRVKFHYVLNETSYTSSYYDDGISETIIKGGFDDAIDTVVGPHNFNPGNENIVQVTTFTDDDANAFPVTWQGEAIVIDNNSGTANETEIETVSVTVSISGVLYACTKPWEGDGIVSFAPVDFDPDLPNVGDDREATITVRMKIRTDSARDNQTIRPRTTVKVEEGTQAYTQVLTGTKAQRVRYQGCEISEEISTHLTSGVLTVGEYLAQTIRLTDDDVNLDAVALEEIEVRNTGNATGAEFSRIEVLRDGVLIGFIDNPAGFAGGQRFALDDGPADWALGDDRSTTLTILYYVGENAVSGHTLKPKVVVRTAEERVDLYWSDDVTYPDVVLLHAPGFEVVKKDPEGPTGGDAYTGQRLLAQQILCRDIDENSDGVTVNPIVVKNVGSASGNPDVVKIEIADIDGNILGSAEDLTGFTTGGVSITTDEYNVLEDSPEGAEMILFVYLTIADPEVAVAGRTVNLETRILHTESGMGYEKSVAGPVWTIRVNHRPVVNFDWTPEVANVGQETQFTADVTDEDGDDIVTHEWSFGEERGGGESDEQDPIYVFGTAGEQEVTLTVTDERGLTGSTTKAVVVNAPPVVEVAMEPEAPGLDENVQFTPTVSDPDDPADEPYTYEWDFDDDEATSDSEAPIHSFAERRTYDVSLTVSDSRGGTTTVVLPVTVGNRAPEVDLNWTPANPDVSELVVFTATVTDLDDPPDTPYTYEWDFGDDDETSSSASPTHRYDERATFTVTLIVTDAREGRTTVEKEISIGNGAPVIGSLSVDPPTPNTGDAVSITASSTTDPDGDSIVSYEWKFGDRSETTTTSNSTTHVYATPGTYTIEAIAVDARGGRSEAKTVQITVAGPTKVVTWAFPNPASTTATISYYLPDGATDPELWIFDLDRSQVLRQTLAAGETEFEWNLRTGDGDAVSNGLYFCIITATKAAGGTTSSDVFLLLVAR